MLSKKEIITKLKNLGFKDESIDGVISDVVQIILGKALGNYFSQLPENEQLRLKKLSIEQFMEYIENNKDSLPKFSNQDFTKIYDETWDDYFNTISK